MREKELTNFVYQIRLSNEVFTNYLAQLGMRIDRNAIDIPQIDQNIIEFEFSVNFGACAENIINRSAVIIREFFQGIDIQITNIGN